MVGEEGISVLAKSFKAELCFWGYGALCGYRDCLFGELDYLCGERTSQAKYSALPWAQERALDRRSLIFSLFRGCICTPQCSITLGMHKLSELMRCWVRSPKQYPQCKQSLRQGALFQAAPSWLCLWFREIYAALRLLFFSKIQWIKWEYEQ